MLYMGRGFSDCRSEGECPDKRGGKREIPNAKRPFNIEFLEKMKAEAELGEKNNSESQQLYVAAVVGFFFSPVGVGNRGD